MLSRHHVVLDDVARVLAPDDLTVLYDAILRLRKVRRANESNYVGDAAEIAEAKIRLVLEDAAGH